MLACGAGGDGDQLGDHAFSATAGDQPAGVTTEAGASAAAPEDTAPPDEPLSGPVFDRIPDVVREVEASVVAVLTEVGEGSGVVWSSDGIVVTNEHVIGLARRIQVGFADGRRVPAQLIAADPLTDLAVLEVERSDLPAATFAEELPDVGELAIAVGNPLGFENTVTAGIVSGLHRGIPGSAPRTQALVDLIQTDAAISPGNSGGALVNADAEVMGINVAYLPPAASAVSIGFAIPSATVIDVVTQLLEDGTVSHAFFGVVPAALTPEVSQRLGVSVDAGVVVLEVVDNGPAATAGLLPGDVLVEMAGERVESVEEFLAILRRHEPGEDIPVTIVRADERVDATVTLSDRPSG